MPTLRKSLEGIKGVAWEENFESELGNIPEKNQDNRDPPSTPPPGSSASTELSGQPDTHTRQENDRPEKVHECNPVELSADREASLNSIWASNALSQHSVSRCLCVAAEAATACPSQTAGIPAYVSGQTLAELAEAGGAESTCGLLFNLTPVETPPSFLRPAGASALTVPVPSSTVQRANPIRSTPASQISLAGEASDVSPS